MLNKKRAFLMGSSNAGLLIRGVTFDGTNDYLARGADLTDNADSKKGIVSFWIKPTDGIVEQTIYISSNGPYDNVLYKNSDGSIDFYLWDPGTPQATMHLKSSAGSVVAANGWHHVMISWDNAITTSHLYINGVYDDESALISNLTTDYTNTNHYIGVDPLAGYGQLNADIAQLYINFGEYLDLSSPANRAKFLSPSGYPVDLGADGSTPTGNDPILYLHLNDGDAVSSFATNKGYGGGMTLTGTLTEAATKPRL